MSEEVVIAVIAKFEGAKVGMRLGWDGEAHLTVTAKDDLRIDLENNFGKKISFYAPEFDTRDFEVIPIPAKVMR